jgi:hypothetical protein
MTAEIVRGLRGGLVHLRAVRTKDARAQRNGLGWRDASGCLELKSSRELCARPRGAKYSDSAGRPYWESNRVNVCCGERARRASQIQQQPGEVPGTLEDAPTPCGSIRRGRSRLAPHCTCRRDPVVASVQPSRNAAGIPAPSRAAGASSRVSVSLLPPSLRARLPLRRSFVRRFLFLPAATKSRGVAGALRSVRERPTGQRRIRSDFDTQRRNRRQADFVGDIG